MRRLDIDQSVRCGVSPAGLRAAAWEHQRVNALPIEHGNFQVGVKRRIRNRQPLIVQHWINGQPQ